MWDFFEALYGRDRQIEIIKNSIEQCAKGTKGLTIVSGQSGIGKTALVQEALKTVKRGYVLSGKFDQPNLNIPYHALIQGFKTMVNHILSQNEIEVLAWRQKIQKALGNSGRLITNFIPQLEHVIGKQPHVPNLPPTESLERFHRVFCEFVSTLEIEREPLILFLDDLQWSDLPSLDLLKQLLQNAKIKNLLVIAVFRSGKDLEGNPVKSRLNLLEKEHPNTVSIRLEPLTSTDVANVLTDRFKNWNPGIKELANCCHRKTGGNPFFLKQFLRSLYDNGLIKLSTVTGEWEWDLKQIEQTQVTENIANILGARLKKLNPEAYELLFLASCIGCRFNLNTIEGIVNDKKITADNNIQELINTGLIIPYDNLLPGESMNVSSGSYRFAHDSIQQLAYSSISKSQKKELHLRIGQAALKTGIEANEDEMIYYHVKQLNHGLDLVSDSKLRDEYAVLNLEAGKRAKAASANTPALQFLTAGRKWLGEKGWQRRYRLMLQISLEEARIESFLGNSLQVNFLIDQICKNAQSFLDRAEALNILISQYTLEGKYPDALQTGWSVLKLFGVHPPNDLDNVFENELKTLYQNLSNIEIDKLIESPLMENQEKKVLIRTLMTMSTSALYTNKDLFSVISLMNVNLSLEYGHTSESCAGYYGTSVMLGTILGKYQLAYKFGDLALKLADKLNNPSQKCKACNAFGSFVSSWTKPIYQAVEIHQQGYQAGLEAGDSLFAGYNLYNQQVNQFYMGTNLQELEIRFPETMAYFQQTGNVLMVDILTGIWSSVSDLTGSDGLDPKLFPEGFSKKRFLERCKSNQSYAAIFVYLTLQSTNAILFENPTTALAMTEEANQHLIPAAGHINHAEWIFFYSLALVMCCSKVDEKKSKQYEDQLLELQEQMRIWSEQCPENFLHKYLLIEAEIAKSKGREMKAVDLYDQSIASARKNGFVHCEALANELAARFWLQKRKFRIAAIYLREAYNGYMFWGAFKKTKQLHHQFADTFPDVFRTLDVSAGDLAIMANDGNFEMIDYSALINAMRIISGEMEFSKLLEKILDIIKRNAGADRCCLIMKKAGEWVIEAEMSSIFEMAENVTNGETSSDIETGKGGRLPDSILNFVSHTGNEVILSDAIRSGLFSKDDYIASFQPKSLACLPLLTRRKIIGFLYFENKMVSDVFTKDRIQILKIIAGQVAISLENARMLDEARGFSGRILAARDEERKRLSRDLHDGLGQSLMAIKLNLQMLGSNSVTSTPELEEQLSDVIQELSLSINELREMASNLRPTFLEKTNLNDVINWQVKKIQERTDIKITTRINKMEDIDISLKENVFRIFQEAINNAVKHSNANLIEIILEEQKQILVLKIVDNGIGFDPSQFRKETLGLGLSSMKERTELIKGSWQIESIPGQGTTIIVKVPLPKPTK